LFQASDGYDPALVVELGCLGRLEESVLIALTVLGAEHIMLAHADCAACPLKRGRTLANTVFATVDTLLAAWGHANPLALTDAIPEVAVMTGMDEGAVTVTAGSGLSRRDFFTQIRTDAQSTVVQTVSNSVLFSEVTPIPEKPAVVKVMQDGTLPHFIPNRRERLLDYLDRLGEVQAPSIDTRLWGTLSIDETLCNSCRMCATFCPTGAIVKYDDPVSSDDHAVETKGSETTYSIGVEHYCADCVECRLCEDICPTKAAHISSLLSTKSLVEGRIVRIPMKPQDYEYNTPDQIYRGMFDLLGGGQIYEYGGANTRPR
jgi:ferredoxin